MGRGYTVHFIGLQNSSQHKQWSDSMAPTLWLPYSPELLILHCNRRQEQERKKSCSYVPYRIDQLVQLSERLSPVVHEGLLGFCWSETVLQTQQDNLVYCNTIRNVSQILELYYFSGKIYNTAWIKVLHR